MSVPPEQFSRITGRVDLARLASSLVVVVGVGTVGSQIAKELAYSGIGRLRLLDGDKFEEVNRSRHVLPRKYVGRNKAEGIAEYLKDEIPALDIEGLANYVDDELADDELDEILLDEDVALIVAATGEDDVQQRVARRALALDIPAVLPALYDSDGGEIFLQRSPQAPCYLCWDAARPDAEPVRGVTALNVDSWGIIQLSVQVCIGVLDSGSPYEELLRAPPNDPRPRQLFIQNRFGLAIQGVDFRPGCPSCVIGPSRRVEQDDRVRPVPRRRDAVSTPRTLPPARVPDNHHPHITHEAPRRKINALVGNLVMALLLLGSACYFIGVVLAGVNHDQAGKHSFAPGLLAILGIFWLCGGVYAVWRSTADFFVDEPRAAWWQFLTRPFRFENDNRDL